MKLTKNHLFSVTFLLVAVMSLPTVGLAQSAITTTPKALKRQADQLVRNHEFHKAIDLYTNVLGENPEISTAYFNLAICYNQVKDYKKAFEALETFVQHNPKDGEAHFNMGIMQIHLGDYNKARNLLKKARALKPSRKIKERIDLALENLKPSTFPEDSLHEVSSFLKQFAH